MAHIGEDTLGIIKENVRQVLLTREAELWTLGTSWHRIFLDDAGAIQDAPCDAPDYACGGVDTDPGFAPSSVEEWVEEDGYPGSLIPARLAAKLALGFVPEPAEPDMMAAVRDIARGS